MLAWLLAATIAGNAYVIDGDTLAIGRTHVRLKGVDAPELGTPLGEAAASAMRALAQGRQVTCRLTGERTHGREVGYCSTAAVDLNRAIVEGGFALSCPRFDPQYRPYEQPSLRLAYPRAPYC